MIGVVAGLLIVALLIVWYALKEPRSWPSPSRSEARIHYAERMDALELFSPATRAWFEQAFDAPTPAQALGWPAIASGEHTLIQAPTGSGKTLAAFLHGVDRLTA